MMGKNRQQFYMILSENIVDWKPHAVFLWCRKFADVQVIYWNWVASHRKPSMNWVWKNHKVLAKMIFTIIL